MGARGRAGERAAHRKLVRANAAGERTFTRAKAEALIARTQTEDGLNEPKLATHKNKHVQAKLSHKLARIRAQTAP